MSSKSIKLDCAVPNGVGAKVLISSFLPAPWTSVDFAFTGWMTAVGVGTITIISDIGTGTLINTQCEQFDSVNLNTMYVYGSTTGLTLCLGGSK